MVARGASEQRRYSFLGGYSLATTMDVVVPSESESSGGNWLGGGGVELSWLVVWLMGQLDR